MRYNAPTAKSTRTTWRVNVREIVAALGIPVDPDQWVVIENAEDDDGSRPLDGWVNIVRWESHRPSTFQHELATPPEACESFSAPNYPR
jgi:hypothetical protein